MRTETYTIAGMHCASCARKIEKIVSRLPGVSEAAVNLATEKLTLSYDEQKLQAAAIADSIDKAGYTAALHQNIKNIVIPIKGMSCASCVAAIEKGLIKAAGVVEIKVNLATERATVSYNPEEIRLSEISRKITELGYEPLELSSSSSKDEDAARKEAEIRSMWRRFWVSIFFTVPLF